MAIFNLKKILAFTALLPAILCAQVGNDDPTAEQGLIGDLVNMPTSNLTRSGGLLRAWLLHRGTAIENNIVPQPACATDVCCPWYAIADDLTKLFVDPTTKECTDDARAAVRLGFHDAASWSKVLSAQGTDNGGADGSFILFREDSRPENNGLQDFVSKLLAIWDNHKQVSAADIVQFAAHHATVSCPQGPRIAFFAGRVDATQPSPPGLLPDVHDSAINLTTLFMDKTINALDLSALLGAHTSSKQFHFDESQAGTSQDTTPGIWDTNFYNDTLQPDAAPGVVRFPSDLVLSKSENMTAPFNSFVGQQARWNEAYAFAYTRLGLLGVNKINDLVDCSNALPPHIPEAPGAVGGSKRIRRSFYH